MEVYGADIAGIEGQLIRFTTTVDLRRRGVALLGNARKVVQQGVTRAMKAIETLEGDWSNIVTDTGYTIDLTPAESPRTTSGLDLPIAITVLRASIQQNLESLASQIEHLEERLANPPGGRSAEDRKRQLLEEIEARVRTQERILKYRRRLQRNGSKYLLIGKLDICSGVISPPEKGMFGMIAGAKPGFTIIVPEDSEVHAYIVAAREPGITALRARDLQEVWNVILGVQRPRKARKKNIRIKRLQLDHHVPDFRDIEGQTRAKRAMTIALAGGHSILLVGLAGHGKTYLATAAAALLPDLRGEEIFELNKIYSAKGELRENELVYTRPYREVRNITYASLFGGGSRPLPGEVSMAHKGVLLIDEINYLSPGTLIEGLRKALDPPHVQKVQRHGGAIEYPCNFMLVAAMNPCKCGDYYHYKCPRCGRTFYGPDARCERHPTERLVHKCKCKPREIEALRNKLSIPLLQRIDLKVLVSRYDETQPEQKDYASSTIKRRISQAREVEGKRYKKAPWWTCNADVLDRTQFRRFAPPIPPRVDAFLKETFDRLDLAPRTEVKVLLVAQTIADYEGANQIRVKDIKEAVDLMGIEQNYFKDMI